MLINQTWEKFDAVYESKSRAAAFLHAAPGPQSVLLAVIALVWLMACS